MDISEARYATLLGITAAHRRLLALLTGLLINGAPSKPAAIAQTLAMLHEQIGQDDMGPNPVEMPQEVANLLSESAQGEIRLIARRLGIEDQAFPRRQAD